MLFENNLDFSDKNINEDIDEDYIYDCLGGRILCRLEPTVSLLNKNKVAGTSGGPNVTGFEKSRLPSQPAVCLSEEDGGM